MRRSFIPIAALCVVALLSPRAWAQPSPTPSAPFEVPPEPGTPPPVSIPTPEIPEPPQPKVEIVRPSPPPDEPPAGAMKPQRSTAPPAETIWWDAGYRYPGTYSTTSLLSLIGKLENAGMKPERALSAAAPFMVAGYARFWDSWGEVRHADTGLRPHLGQDVFCSDGAPVLASERGTLDYGQDASGGLVARVHRGDGSYWYYAHLSRFEPARATGDAVEPGDVIGYCRNSGNAAGTPPHVHFSFFVNHVAQNPMGALIGWLKRAEAESKRLLRKLKRRDRSVKETVFKSPVEESFMPPPSEHCYTASLNEALDLALLLTPED